MSVFVVFVTPYFTPAALQFLESLSGLRGVRLGVISQEPQEVLPHQLQRHFLGHWRVHDILNPDHLQWAARELARQHGPIHRLLAANEQVQVPLAHVRERLGIEGMDVETALNFRDKARMKEKFRAGGVPCARHCAASTEDEAWAFLSEVGLPVCVKPVDGAAAQATYRVDNTKNFREVLRASGPTAERPLQIEEFVVGEEHSFETMMLGGVPMWHSLTRYLPTPLETMQNPWIQWRIILPKEVDSPQYDDIRKVGRTALKVLGSPTALSHLEWFRRPNGTLAVGEVGARPPGAQIVPLINRAHDIDLFRAWGRMMIFDEFDPPKKRKFAAGVAFLRGLGGGRVKAVHGLDEVLHELGERVTDVRRPMYLQQAATTYEGEGFVIVRARTTKEVEDALAQVINRVRVEMVH